MFLMVIVKTRDSIEGLDFVIDNIKKGISEVHKGVVKKIFILFEGVRELVEYREEIAYIAEKLERDMDMHIFILEKRRYKPEDGNYSIDIWSALNNFNFQ